MDEDDLKYSQKAKSQIFRSIQTRQYQRGNSSAVTDSSQGLPAVDEVDLDRELLSGHDLQSPVDECYRKNDEDISNARDLKEMFKLEDKK